MPRKRGPRRTTTCLKRRKRFRTNYTHHTVPLKYKKQLSDSWDKTEEWLLRQDALELAVLADLESKTW